jgi:glyoxylase-like metal-dependent hydrolase (beta-lactamase superfamily II)
MHTRVLMIAVVAAFAVQIADAQQSKPPAKESSANTASANALDVKQTLRAVGLALGELRGPNFVDAISTLEFWANGTMNAIGQAYKPGDAWPAFKVTSYHAWLDFNQPAMRVDLTRTNPDGTTKGGGGLPLAAPQRQGTAVSGKYAWNESEPAAGLVPGKGTVVPAMGAVNDRLLQIWTMPYAVFKVATKAGDRAKATIENGTKIITVPLDGQGLPGITLRATVDAKNLISHVEVKTDNPVLGDMVTETTYSDYKDIGEIPSDVQFPTRITVKQGGYPVLDLTITKTDTNNPYLIVPVPDAIQKAASSPAPTPVKVDAQKLAEGVWFLTGGTHNSVAVEFKDHVVLVECPLNDERSLAVVETVRKTIPNKPLRYVVDTHDHFDHAGGLRGCVSEGLTVITHAENKPYFEKVWAQPHTINPDRLAKMPRKPVIEAAMDKRLLTDSAHTLELYHLEGSDHAASMIIAYLPKERILIEADEFNPPPPNAPAGPVIKENQVLYDNIQRLKLNVQQIAPIHGRLVTIDDLRKAIGKTGGT